MNKPLGAPQLKAGRGTTHRAGEQARLEHSPPHSVPIYVLPRGGAEKAAAILPLAVLAPPRGAGRMEGTGGRKR